MRSLQVKLRPGKHRPWPRPQGPLVDLNHRASVRATRFRPDLVQGMRTSNSKPISTRVDSVGARPRAMSISDAFLGCDRSRQVIRRHKLEWHIWMRHYQHHLDVPVLLEIGHALDQTGQDAPTELVGAAEQGRAEL